MNQKRQKQHKAAAFFLAALLCGAGICGCGKQDSGVESSKEANPSVAENARQEVTVGAIRCDASVTELTLSDADIAELETLLPQLSQLKTLTLEGALPSGQALMSLNQKFPEVALVFPVRLGDRSFSSDALTLDLSGDAVTMAELTEKLPLFFSLQELKLPESGLTDEEKMHLADSVHPVSVICSLPLAGKYHPTDSVEIDISGTAVSVGEIEQMLPYFPRLQKLDMSFCGISDEEMDALNQRHPEISIVWTLTIGNVKTRTDAIYFYPAESNYYPSNEEMKKLRYCTELIAVDIGHTRATDCEFLWYTPKVKYLILADTGITDISPVGNLKDLIYLELFNLKTDDYSPLLNCTKLQDLNIGTTHADPEPLSKMTWLHNLQWHRADYDPGTREAVLKLPEQLPDTNVVLYPRNKARNIGGPWRYIPNYYIFRDIIGATYFNQDQIGDYWGEEDGARIMACESGRSFSGLTLAEIIRERIDSGEPIIGIKNIGSEKAEILYETLLAAEPYAKVKR